MDFFAGETVVLTAEAPFSLSMTIDITDRANGVVVNPTDMMDDGEGFYHYDYNIPAESKRGKVEVYFTATDGIRVTKSKLTFGIV